MTCSCDCTCCRRRTLDCFVCGFPLNRVINDVVRYGGKEALSVVACENGHQHALTESLRTMDGTVERQAQRAERLRAQRAMPDRAIKATS